MYLQPTQVATAYQNNAQILTVAAATLADLINTGKVSMEIAQAALITHQSKIPSDHVLHLLGAIDDVWAFEGHPEGAYTEEIVNLMSVLLHGLYNAQQGV